MEKTIRERWIEALESGTYKQGQRRLRNFDDEFCCLGVGADIIDPDAWTLDTEDVIIDGDRVTARKWKNRNDLLSRGGVDTYYLNLLELSISDETFLAELNDEGATFEEISWLLRRQSETGKSLIDCYEILSDG